MGKKKEITRPRRVVIDTNVAVSALVFRAGRLAWLREAWSDARVVPLVSADTLAELVRVLGYPKLGLTAEEAKTVLAHYMEHAEAVSEVGASVVVPQCRDEDDRMFLRLAYCAHADALVTGDDDLLVIAGKSRIPVVSPESFRRMLQD